MNRNEAKIMLALDKIQRQTKKGVYDVWEIHELTDLSKKDFDEATLRLYFDDMVELHAEDDESLSPEEKRKVIRFQGEVYIMMAFTDKGESFMEAKRQEKKEKQNPNNPKNSHEEIVLRTMERLGNKVHLLWEVQEKSGLNKPDFDTAMIGLYQKRKVDLHFHDYPASLNKEDRDKLLWYQDVPYLAVHMRR